MRTSWRGRLSHLHSITELGECLASKFLSNLRKVVALLFLDMVADILDEDCDFGIEGLFVRIHVLHFGQHPLHNVMLFDAFKHHVVHSGDSRPGRRVEEFLLDRRVRRQLFDDLVDDGAF